MGKPQRISEEALEDIFGLKKEYEKRTGENTTIDDIVTAAIKSASEDKLLKEIRRRKKQENTSKDNISIFDEYFNL